MISSPSPFELVKRVDAPKMLRLIGTPEKLDVVDASGIEILLHAFCDGYDVELRNVEITAPIELVSVIGKLPLDSDGRRRVAGDFNLRNVHFNEVVHLQGAAFTQRGFFHSCVFHKKVSFNGGAFRGDADFTGTQFRGDACFESIEFEAETSFEDATFLREARFARTNMSKPANFGGVRFRENTVLRGLWNTLLHPIVNGIARLLGKAITGLAVTTFVGLNTDLMDVASNRYLRRYIDDEQWIAAWRRRGGLRRIAYFFWEITSHCGRSLGLWALWAAIVAIAFGAVYARYPVPNWMPEPIAHVLTEMSPEIQVEPATRDASPFTPYYFSIVTFTTLGFGDIKPLNRAAEIWLVIEVVLGYIMLGGLIAIFANKFARRN